MIGVFFMPNWIKKSFVALVTILTFGLISPYQIMNATNMELDKPENDGVVEAKETSSNQSIEYEFKEAQAKSLLSRRDQFLSHALEQAELQSIMKFGGRIAPVIEDEFQTVILPNMQLAIQEVTALFGDDELTNLSISEKPGKGQSEKIFHIYDEYTGKDVIRFHVRRDLRPLEGYWFNFHYHTYHDNFQTHYSLGDIYWDKNTPPNWMN